MIVKKSFNFLQNKKQEWSKRGKRRGEEKSREIEDKGNESEGTKLIECK